VNKTSDNLSDPRALLRTWFDDAVNAADPMLCLPDFLPDVPQNGRTVVIGAGKGSAAMARAFEANWNGPVSGLVVTRYGFSQTCDHIEIIEARHPVPDQAGLEAAKRILALATSLGPGDLCVALISGGASALLTLPAPGIEFADKTEVNRQLLASGAPISDINTVRKHLSAIKGGKLANAVMPARLHTLLISDIPGDNPAMVGSGPTVFDETTVHDAVGILNKFNIDPGKRIRRYLNQEMIKEASLIKKNDDRITTQMIATPKDSIDAAAKSAMEAGITPIILGDDIEGEARDLGKEHARLAKSLQSDGQHKPPFVLLSGGECTVTLKSGGAGGPNGEYALAAAIELGGTDGIYVLACDTDGIDGSEDNAGAFAVPDTLLRAQSLAMNATEYLTANNSYGFFQKLDDLLITGPTLTNVNDFRAVLVLS